MVCIQNVFAMKPLLKGCFMAVLLCFCMRTAGASGVVLIARKMAVKVVWADSPRRADSVTERGCFMGRGQSYGDV